MSEKKINPSLKKGLKGPCSIYPIFFFDEVSNQTWEKTFINSLVEAPAEYFINLEKSSLSYLSKNDTQSLFFYQYGKVFEKARDYLRDPSEDQLKYLLGCLKNQEKIITHHELNWPNELLFISLAHGYLNFAKSILNTGALSRKLMAVSEFYLFQAQDQGPEHKNFMLLNVLILIGRGKWEEATKKLHESLKRNPSAPHLKVLCLMYIKIGMPQVARFLRQKQVRQGLKSMERMIA